jgi:PAP2 superfamily
MSNTLALPARRIDYSSFKTWAFPHWGLWALVISVFIINAFWLGIDQRLSVEPQWFRNNLVLIAAGFAAIALRCYRPAMFDWFLHRLWCLLTAVLLSGVLMQNLQVANHLIMSIPFPMADETLMNWDHALSFDWLAYSKAITASPLITKILFFAYNELTFSGLAALAGIIIILDKRIRAIEIIFLVATTAIICEIVSVAFPAEATMALLADPELLSRLKLGTGVLHVEQLRELRSSAPVVMESHNMQGLVSFPSFHTCMALIMMWCSRGFWATNLIGIAIGTLIIIGTPLFGGHYLADLIGGALVTAIALLTWRIKIEPNLSASIDGKEFTRPLPNSLRIFK